MESSSLRSKANPKEFKKLIQNTSDLAKNWAIQKFPQKTDYAIVS